MPTLASSNRAQLRYKKEGNYPTNYGVIQVGNGYNLRMTGESLSYNLQSQTSQEIRSDRQTSDLILTGAQTGGGFNFELSYKEYDPFLEGILQSTWTAYGTNGVSAAIGSLTLAAGTITAGVAPTGNDAFTTLQKGQWIRIVPPAGASQTVKDYLNSRAFRVSTTTAPTSTVITLDGATQIDTTKAGTSLTNAQISSSRMTNGTTMPSFDLEVGYEDVGQFLCYRGMIPSKMSLDIQPGNIVTGSMEFVGKDMVINATTQMGTPVASLAYTPINAVAGVFDVFEGTTMASLSASTFIKSVKLDVDNGLRGQTAVGVFGNAGIAAGQLAVSGSVEVYFADVSLYNKFLQNTDTALYVPLLDPSGNGYVLALPRLKFSSGQVQAGGLNQDVMVNMGFSGLMDTDATSPTYQKSIALYRVGV